MTRWFWIGCIAIFGGGWVAGANMAILVPAAPAFAPAWWKVGLSVFMAFISALLIRSEGSSQ